MRPKGPPFSQSEVLNNFREVKETVATDRRSPIHNVSYTSALSGSAGACIQQSVFDSAKYDCSIDEISTNAIATIHALVSSAFYTTQRNMFSPITCNHGIV